MTETYDKNLDLFLRVNPSLREILPSYQMGNWEWCETDKKETNLKRDIKGHTMYLHSPQGAVDEIARWFFTQFNHQCKSWFIFGLGLGYHYDVMKSWLRQDKNRFLVFIEDDLEVIKKFLSLDKAFDLLNDPQVIVRFFYLPKEDYRIFTEQFNSLLAGFFHLSPSLHALDSYRLYREQMFNVLTQMINLAWAELNMTYQAIVVHSFPEEFYNFYQNFPYVHQSYSFEKMHGLFPNIPILMCGAGPSLELNFPLLKKLENQALIVGGGSALNALSAHSIIPHFGGGVDPTLNQKSRFLSNQAFEVPIAYMGRFNHDAFEVIKGPKLYVKGLIGFPAGFWFENKLKMFTGPYVADFGISTPTFLTTVLSKLGTKQIVLCGMDLSFKQQKRYSPGIQAHPTDLLEVKKFTHSVHSDLIPAKNSLGETVYTSMQMKYEASYYAEFAQMNPHISLINATVTGLDIFQVPSQPLHTLEFTRSYDLRGRIHAAIQNARFTFTFDEVKTALDEWKSSFEKCLKAIEENLETLSKTESIPEFESQLKKTATFADEPAYSMVLSVYMTILEPDFFLDNYQMDCHPERFSEQEIFDKKHAYHKRRLEFMKHACDWHVKIIEKSLNEYADNQSLLKGFSSKSLLEAPKRNPPKHDYPKISASHRVVEQVDEVNGMWEGAYRVYYPSGILFGESHYISGILNGPSKFYDEDRNLLAETVFVNGQRQGDCWFYYSSGSVYSRQRYQKGLLHGPQEYFYADGKLKTLMNYRDGVLEGEVKIFHENGAREREMHFLQGKLNGFEYGWNAADKLIHESQYKMGRPIGTSRVWDKDGKLLQLYTYHGDTGNYDITEWDSEGKVVRNEVHQSAGMLDDIQHKSDELTKSIADLKSELERIKKERS